MAWTRIQYVHFYETFLAAYDPTERKRRGVYYTPEPVISYIVRSVDNLLRERFQCPDGLADFGKARFVDSQGNVQEAHQSAGAGSGLWHWLVSLRGCQVHPRELPNQLDKLAFGALTSIITCLPRLFGFELLMSGVRDGSPEVGNATGSVGPARKYSGTDWAYQFEAHERLRVYLSNTLEQSESEICPTPAWFVASVRGRGKRCKTDIKRELPIMVVLGQSAIFRAFSQREPEER